jgi:putative copper resistance protein D
VGLAAVLLLVATGAINSWFLVGSVDRLITTPYGGLLSAKLALFAGMVGLAAGNRLRHVPALARGLSEGEDPRIVLHRLRGHITAELILGVFVLAAVAAMGAISPAREVA